MELIACPLGMRHISCLVVSVSYAMWNITSILPKRKSHRLLELGEPTSFIFIYILKLFAAVNTRKPRDVSHTSNTYVFQMCQMSYDICQHICQTKCQRHLAYMSYNICMSYGEHMCKTYASQLCHLLSHHIWVPSTAGTSGKQMFLTYVSHLGIWGVYGRHILATDGEHMVYIQSGFICTAYALCMPARWWRMGPICCPYGICHPTYVSHTGTATCNFCQKK